MDRDNALGAYLRARRELVQPQDVGLRATGQRRVAGLRTPKIRTSPRLSASCPSRASGSANSGPGTTCTRAKAGPVTCAIRRSATSNYDVRNGGADGQVLVIYHAEPGTDSAQALALLGSIAASEEAAEAATDEAAEVAAEHVTERDAEVASGPHPGNGIGR
jgi:hypothetical protein